MSNSDLSQTNELIPHNVYFEGKVQSLGLETSNGKATLGVMKKGTYRFSTSTPEKMIVIAGSMDVKLEEDSYKKYQAHDEFEVPADTSFDVICEADVAYICYYAYQEVNG